MTSRYLGRRLARISLAILVLAAAAASFAAAGSLTKQLAPGVALTQQIQLCPQTPLIINVVTVDPKSPEVSIRPEIGMGVVYADGWTKGRETVAASVARSKALVGINADFFPFTGDPLGVCIIDGALVSEPGESRAAFALCEDGTTFFDNPRLDAKVSLERGISRQIDGINRVRETNEAVFYTEAFGPTTRNKYKGTDVVVESAGLPVVVGRAIKLTVKDVKQDAVDVPIPKGGAVLSAGGPAAWFLKENVKPGDILYVQFDIKSLTGHDWTSVRQAVGGGPWLVKNGSQFIDWEAEGFKSGFSTGKHPRTGLGVTSEGKVLLVTVDGRQSISDGVTLPEFAGLMIRLGAVEAINLDGGGSTTMSVRGLVVNSPSAGEQRPVANALLVFGEPAAVSDLPGLTISGVGKQVPISGGAQLFMTWGDQSDILTQDQLQDVVWGTLKGDSFVNQHGYLVPRALGQTDIAAAYGSQLIEFSVNAVGAPAKLTLAVAPDEIDESRAAVTVTVYDANSSRLVDKEVSLTVTGGTAESPCGLTAEEGEFITTVTWDESVQVRRVAASVGEIVVQTECPLPQESSEPSPAPAAVDTAQ